MKGCTLVLTFVFFCTTSVAQERMDEFTIPAASGCANLNYCQDCIGSKPTFKGDLTKYFARKINWLKLEGVKGMVIINISVDSTGRVCCNQLINRTYYSNEQIRDLYLDAIVNQMPDWKPAIKGSQPVNTQASLAVYCMVQDRKDFEVAYYDLDTAKVLKPVQVK